MASPLGSPYNPLPPGIRPDGGVNMLAMNVYGPSDPATMAGLGLPQQIGGVSQNYDGDPEVMRQAYAEQEARLGPMRLPSESSSEGLGLPTSTSGYHVSSGNSGGGSDFNWLMALGAGLQSAGAAHFGNFNVPQQYFQLKQQRDQMAAQAEERKQAFAMQQAKLAEEQKQHAFQQVTAVLTNKDASESQKATLLEELAKGNNPQIAQFARTAMDGIGKKRLSRIGLYMDRYPGQMQKLAEGMMNGSVSSDDIDARLGLIDEIEKHNAKITGEMELENEIKNNPNAPPGAKSWLAEREAKRMKEQAEANVKNQTQRAEIENANLKPDLTRAHIDEAGRDKSTMNKLAEGLVNKPWKDLSQEERKQVLAWDQSREIEKQEAGARAREQVKTESSLAPGVMIHKTMTDMVKGVKDLFLDESESTLKRVGQMAVTRGKFFAGDENMRKWSQMEDGMRATLARMAMEVGNLAATEQDRAKQLVPDLYGSFRGVPDSKQVAEKKLQLLGEFLQAGLEGPQGPDAQSRVQNKLRETLAKLDKVDPLPPIGEVSKDEEAMIKSMQAEGKDKRSIQAAILQKRGVQ